MVFEAAIARAGMLRVDTLQELFLAAQMLSRFRSNTSDTITIVTNGGAGVMAADAATDADVKLSELGAVTQQQLDAVLPPNWSHGKPVDINGDAPVERYEQALRILNAAPASGAALLIHALTAAVASTDIARTLGHWHCIKKGRRRA
jgi:acetyltransferase